MEKRKIERRGGSRPGAGRPCIDPSKRKKTMTLRLDPDIYDYIDKNAENRSVFIEEVVKDYIKNNN